MTNYKPPYTITDKMLEYVASISEKVGSLKNHSHLETRPHLRRNNRIKSIHLQMEMGEWPDCGIRYCCINGEIFLNIFRWKARLKNFNPNIMKQLQYVMEMLGIKSRETFRKNYMNPALEMGIVTMTIPDKPNSRNQRYVRK